MLLLVEYLGIENPNINVKYNRFAGKSGQIGQHYPSKGCIVQANPVCLRTSVDFQPDSSKILGEAYEKVVAMEGK